MSISLNGVSFTILANKENHIDFTSNEHSGVFTLHPDMTITYNGTDSMCNSSSDYREYVKTIFLDLVLHNSQ